MRHQSNLAAQAGIRIREWMEGAIWLPRELCAAAEPTGMKNALLAEGVTL